MPRGGNRRHLQAGDPYLQYAGLLFRRMFEDQSPAGQAFRDDSDRLYLEYKRLIAVILRHPVGGFPSGAPPPFSYIKQFFERLQATLPVECPRLLTLAPAEQEEALWRRGLANNAEQKMWRSRELNSDQDGLARMERLAAASRALWEWALSLERRTDRPRSYRRSTRVVVRRYLADVAAFCERWRLRADWSESAIIDHHFMRLRYGVMRPLALSVSATWEGDDVPLVVKVPGASSDAFERDRHLMVSFVMVHDVLDGPSPIRLNWVPDQGEQRRVERERNAACVVIRWDGHRSSGDAANINRYAADECTERVGRPLTKPELREIRRQLDPQVREARNHFQERGWRVVSDAPLEEHARWLARRLLTRSSFEEIASSFTQLDSARMIDPTAVARACRQFAQNAHLTLPPRAPRRSARRA